jgi:hypothetical protein
MTKKHLHSGGTAISHSGAHPLFFRAIGEDCQPKLTDYEERNGYSYVYCRISVDYR